MLQKKRVYTHTAPDEPALEQLRALIAAMDCATVVPDAADADIVVVLLSDALADDAALMGWANAAADGKIKLIGVRAYPAAPCPDALRIAGRGIVDLTAEALHQAICLDSFAPDGGGGGFSPKPHYCGKRDR